MNSPNTDQQDQHLHQVITQAYCDDASPQLTSRVLEKIHRRRRIKRIVINSAASALAAGIVLLVTLTPTLETPQPTSSDPLASDSLDTAYLAAAPPLVTFNVIDNDQTAILDFLQSLDGDIK